MDEQKKLHFQNVYEQISDQGLLEMGESGPFEFQEGVYEIILKEVRKRKLEEELNERKKLKEYQEKARKKLEEMQEKARKINLDFVTVKQFLYRNEAEFSKSVLEGMGIEAMVLADDCGGLRPHLAFGMGGVKLLVKKEDFKIAKVILEDSEK